MPKSKPHKGILKRVKITARGKVKFNKPFAGHLQGPKSGRRRQKIAGFACAKKGDIVLLEKMLHRRLTPSN
jgi:large subunit ribosomal protein L35